MKFSLKMLSLNSVLFLGLSSIGTSEAFTLSSTNTSPTRSEHRRRSGLFCATTDVRGTAVGSKFESWYQKTIESLSLVEPLVPIELEDSFSSNVGSLGKMNMTFRSMAWQSKSLRYIRLISFVGEGYDVFNFMAVPRAGTAVPILGIDVVSLPSE
jgi:Ferredoxin-dependent bilin reductase